MCTIYKLIFHKIQNALQKNGYSVVTEPEESDICLAGLCAAFDADEKRSMEIVEIMEQAEKPIYLYGCMTTVNSVDLPAGRQYPSWKPDKLVQELLHQESSCWDREPLPNAFRALNDYRVHNPHKKYLGISTGCSFFCSYCPHKLGAGNIVSFPEGEILNQIKALNNKGTETIVITGTDTASYGVDIGSSISNLLRKILSLLEPHITIHLSQFNPEGLFIPKGSSDMLLELFSRETFGDIQLPVQSASLRLLHLMQRKYDLDELDSFLTRIKNRNPRLMLRTDLMVGFPTETYEDLDAGIAFACKHYSEIAVYAFEMKRGTLISKMNLPEFPEEEKEARRLYAIDKVRKTGILAHSGGQCLETLIQNDILKEGIRKKAA